MERLAQRGHHVVGLDSLNPALPTAEPKHTVVTRASIELGVHTHVEDIRDRAALERLFAQNRFDTVVHLAALAGIRDAVLNPRLYVEVDLNGTQNVLDAALAGGCGHVVFASTSSVYGDSAAVPFREDDAADRPRQPYAAAKRAAEILAHAYHHLHGLHVTVLRLFTVYGPRNRPDMMAFRLARSVMHGDVVELFNGGVGVQRDWTFVDDIVDGFVRAVERPLGYEIINLGRGEPVELRSFVSCLESVSGRQACVQPTAIPPADMRTTHADISKARLLLGYEPGVGLREGVERLWNWYTAQSRHPDLAAVGQRAA